MILEENIIISHVYNNKKLVNKLLYTQEGIIEKHYQTKKRTMWTMWIDIMSLRSIFFKKKKGTK